MMGLWFVGACWRSDWAMLVFSALPPCLLNSVLLLELELGLSRTAAGVGFSSMVLPVGTSFAGCVLWAWRTADG